MIGHRAHPRVANLNNYVLLPESGGATCHGGAYLIQILPSGRRHSSEMPLTQIQSLL